MNKFKNKVASQADIIPNHIITAIKEIPSHNAKTIASQQARIQQLEVRNEYLSGLIQGYDSAIAELKIEELKHILTMRKRTYPTCEVVTVYDIEQRIKELNNG